jgi:hypothetical protein
MFVRLKGATLPGKIVPIPFVLLSLGVTNDPRKVRTGPWPQLFGDDAMTNKRTDRCHPPERKFAELRCRSDASNLMTIRL